MNCNSDPEISAASHRFATVVHNLPMAKNTFRLRLHSPEVASSLLPGQFVMLRLPQRSDPLLGRPFALFETFSDSTGKVTEFEIGYVVIGKMTSLLTELTPGQSIEVWGPLGHPFPDPTPGHLAIVAGGIGQTPFLPVIREALRQREYGLPPRNVAQSPRKITLCYGVRSEAYLAGLSEFQSTGVEIRISTDDGTRGYHGYVTDVLQNLCESNDPPQQILCCGPEPLMRAVRQIALKHDINCLLSLETPMSCGFGACFSCVTPVKQANGGWDYRRVCVEGPIFPAADVLFEESELSPATKAGSH